MVPAALLTRPPGTHLLPTCGGRPGRPGWAIQHVCTTARPVRAAASAAAGTALPSGQLPSTMLPPWAAEPEPEPVGEELGWPVDFENRWGLGKCLGIGSFGVVYEAYNFETGQRGAAKVLGKERRNCNRAKTLRRLRREAVILDRCSSLAHVARLQEVYEKENYVYLVLEAVRGGDLEQLLERRGQLSEAEVATVAYECLKMLRALHRSGIVHGDVKPANFILVHEYGTQRLDTVRKDPEGVPLLKACDFGCAQVLKEPAGELTKRTGTPVFMAPEVFDRAYNTQADMWSLGMTLYQLLAGRLPFWPSTDACRASSVQQVRAAVCGAAPVPLTGGVWSDLSRECAEFLAGLLERDPSRRPCAEAAMAAPWFERFC